MTRVRTVDRSAQAVSILYQAARAGVAAGALIIETEAKMLLGRKGPIEVSQPGEPPAVKTGHLRRSVITEIVERPSNITAKIGPAADYGPHLEFGTRNIAPRPFMRPAIDTKGKEATQAIRDHLARGLEKLPKAG